MKSIKLIIKGMHCEACEKNLRHAISKLDNVRNINLKYTDENAEIFYNQEINLIELTNIIENLGYEAIIQRETKKPDFNNFINEILSGKDIEKEVLVLFFNIFLVLGIMEIISYFSFFSNINNFFSQYGYYIIFLIISAVLITSSLWHIKAYGSQFSCMSGMMIGMTIGMLSGFLIGAVVGATNGIFIGSLTGILAGMAIGSWCGNCCGIMGILEGMMAGLMGGLMGAMTSLMMINDHIKLIFPVIFLSSAMILLGLDYMVFKEARTKDIKNFYKYNKFNFITICFIITMSITLLMVYGPKSIFFK